MSPRRMMPSDYFNSRPCVRGNLVKREYSRAYRVFQFTPLREGQPSRTKVSASKRIFQFTPLREGQRLLRSRSYEWCSNFNSRPCVRGNGRGVPGCRRAGQFQFTPLREGQP